MREREIRFFARECVNLGKKTRESDKKNHTLIPKVTDHKFQVK